MTNAEQEALDRKKKFFGWVLVILVIGGGLLLQGNKPAPDSDAAICPITKATDPDMQKFYDEAHNQCLGMKHDLQQVYHYHEGQSP